jgi:formyl-CoA transferase
MVEVPMLETITGFWLVEHLFNKSYVPPRGEMGYSRVLSADRKPYRTKDGYICALPYNEKHYRAFAAEIGQPELMSDPRFATAKARSDNQPAIQAIIAEVMPTRTTAEWLDFLEKADIPSMMVNDLDQLFDDPHLKETGFFQTREHPTEGAIRTTASPFAFSTTPTDYRRHAPLLGADGREVLAEAGLSNEEIAALESSGAMKVVRPS